MEKPLVSIVIPALNEKHYLPHLLRDLKRQTYRPIEIIVADAGSTDGTREIAESMGAKVVDGGRPAEGRNRGARASRGEYLIFLDADTRVRSDFVERAIREFDREYYESATFRFQPISSFRIDHLLFRMTNILIRASSRLYPYAPGFGIMATRRIFRRIGGFDESVYLAEDHDFVRRASRIARFGVISSTPIRVSVRRLDKEGRINLILKYMKAEIYRFFRGKVDREIVDYEFARFEEGKRDLASLEEFLERVLRLMEKFTG